MSLERIRGTAFETFLLVALFAVGFGVGKVAPDCGGYHETVAEQVIEGRHELVPTDADHPGRAFTYTVRQLGDGWTAADIGFAWRLPDGTLVEDSMAAERVSFAVTDNFDSPLVEMVLRREMSGPICDDEGSTPQELTHACTATVVIRCTAEQLRQALQGVE